MTSWSRGPAATHAQLTYLKEDQLKMASINPSQIASDPETERLTHLRTGKKQLPVTLLGFHSLVNMRKNYKKAWKEEK